MPTVRINVCCSGMQNMISDKTIMKSNSTNLYWIKVVEHDGTEELASNSTHHNYNKINHCPFCGNVIVENVQWT